LIYRHDMRCRVMPQVGHGRRACVHRGDQPGLGRAVTGTRSSAIQGDGKGFQQRIDMGERAWGLPNQPLIITHWTGPEGTRLEETSL